MGRYGGWGAADAVFAPGASGNDLRDRERLRAVLTRLGGSGEAGERLFRSAGLTVLNAHYTDPMLVGAIYQALAKLGLVQGTVVEPGAGSGQFAAFAPAGIRITGVELDPATALIAQLLHPDAEILTGSVSDPRFARVRDQSAAPVRVPRDTADGFAGNVPFSEVKWPDEVLNPGTRFSLHDHAIRWGVTRVAPGGLCAFITSRYTADAVNPRFRRTLAGELDLIGMVRLPSTAHKRMAGTPVITDIIIGRRIADGERPLTSPETWEQSRPLAIPGSSLTARVNTYFHDNPQHVLGALQPGGMYRAGDFTVAPSGDLEQQLGAALGEITGRALAAGQRCQPRLAARPVIEILSRRPDGTITAKRDGAFTQVVHGQDVPLVISSEREADQTRKLVALAEARSTLISAEASCPEDTGEIDAMRARMGVLYDAYTAAYGPIGRFTTRIVTYHVKTLEGVLDRLDFSRKDVPDPEVTLLEAYLGRHALTRIVNSAASPEHVRQGTRKDKHGETVTTATQLVEVARVRAALMTALAQIPQGADADTLAATFGERMSRIETGEQRTRLMPAAFRSDPRRPAVEALETFDPVTQTAAKKAVFSRRTAMPHRMELGADTPQEALDLVLIHRRRVDLGEIARLLGTGEAEARAQLGTLVFDDPASGDLIAAGEYLSGNVREKLAAARTAAAGDPERHTANVDSLEAVQPPALAAEDIQARLGSAWLSREIVQEGLRYVLQDPRLTVIHPGGSEWKVESRTARNSRAQDTYGTSDWNALDLAGALLTNASITVRRTTIDPVTGAERSYRDDAATLFAFRKAQRLDADFVSWLWSDPERADECVRLYNNAYNNQVKRVWDASPFYIPGLAPGIKLHPFQNAMVRRLHTESGLAAWVVGAGKTELGITAAMEGARLGRHELTAIVTPASLVNQWRDRIYRTYPEARVLVADDDLRGRKDSRAVFTERAASGDYQLAITPYEFFGSLALSADAARASVDEEIDKLTRYAQEAAAQGDRYTAKELQGKIAKLEAKYSAAVKASGGAAGFTDTRINGIVVDEWHNFRRIKRDSNNRLLAMPGSGRANHMLAVFDYLRKHHPDGLRLGLSGTPLEQSIADAWAAMRFFTPERLKALGLEEFDAFLTTFGRTEPRREPTPTGSGLHVRERQADWFNLPDMRRTLWDPFADVVRRADLGLNLPRLAGGRPQTHVLPQTPGQAHMQADIDHRYELFKAGDREGDNHILKLMDQAGKNALHPRMLGMGTDGKIKLEVWADAAAAWYHATKDTGFLDRDGNPHPVPGALRMVACELGVPDAARPNAWSVYSEMRSLLAARGVPAQAVRFAQDADSDRKKAALWEDARTGRCNFVIGSAQTAGTGVDVPDRLQVLDYMTLSWNPTQFEQWLGRIVRQGNQNPEVAAHVWATEGTIEVLRADKIAMKSAPFEALLDGTSETRRLTEEADDPISAWAAEMTARMSGNPLLTAQREAQLEVDVAQGMQNEWQRENGVKARRLAVMDKEIQELEAENAAIDGALSRAVDTRGDKFAARVGTGRYTVRAEAGAALIAALTATAAGDVSTLTGGNPQHLAELAGFPVTARYNRVTVTMPAGAADGQDAGPDAEPAERTLITLGLEGVPQGQVGVIDAADLPGRDPAALITSLEDRIRRLPGHKAKNTAAIAGNRDQITKTRAELAQPSPYLQQLADARDALDRIEAQINEQIKDDTPAPDAAGTGAGTLAGAAPAVPAPSGPPDEGQERAGTGTGPPPSGPETGQHPPGPAEPAPVPVSPPSASGLPAPAAPGVQAGHAVSTTSATPVADEAADGDHPSSPDGAEKPDAGQASPGSGLTREDLDFAYQHAYEYALGTSRDPDPEQEERALDYATWYLAAYRDEESMADLPGHRHAWARFADQGYPAREPAITANGQRDQDQPGTGADATAAYTGDPPPADGQPHDTDPSAATARLLAVVLGGYGDVDEMAAAQVAIEQAWQAVGEAGFAGGLPDGRLRTQYYQLEAAIIAAQLARDTRTATEALQGLAHQAERLGDDATQPGEHALGCAARQLSAAAHAHLARLTATGTTADGLLNAAVDRRRQAGGEQNPVPAFPDPLGQHHEPYRDRTEVTQARESIFRSRDTWLRELRDSELSEDATRLRGVLERLERTPDRDHLAHQRATWNEAVSAALGAMSGHAATPVLPGLLSAIYRHHQRLDAYHIQARYAPAPYDSADAYTAGHDEIRQARQAWQESMTGSRLRNLTDRQARGTDWWDIRAAQRAVSGALTTAADAAAAGDLDYAARQALEAAGACHTLRLSLTRADYASPADYDRLDALTRAAHRHAARLGAARDTGLAPALGAALAERGATAPVPDESHEDQEQPAAGDPADETVTGLVIEHDHQGTLVRGTDKNDQQLRGLLHDQGFRWSANLQAWYLPRPWTYSTRNQRVSSLTAGLRQAGRSFTLRGQPSSPGATPGSQPQPEPLPAADPYTDIRQARSDHSRAISDYWALTHTPAGNNVMSTYPESGARPDALALNAAYKAVRVSWEEAFAGDPREVTGRFTAWVQAASALSRNLGAEQHRAPKFRQILDTFIGSATRLASRTQATAEDPAAWARVFAGLPAAAPDAGPTLEIGIPDPAQSAVSSPDHDVSPAEGEQARQHSRENEHPASPADAVPGSSADTETALPAVCRNAADLRQLAAAYLLSTGTGPAGVRGTQLTVVHDHGRTVLLHDDVSGTSAGGYRLDPGDVPAYLAGYLRYPQLPPRCLAGLARRDPAAPGGLTLAGARETAARLNLEVRVRRVAGQSYITFCEPGITGLPVLSYPAGTGSALHGPSTVPVAAIGSYLFSYRRSIPAAMFTAPAAAPPDWARRVTQLTPHLIDEGGYFIRAARDHLHTALAAARDGNTDEAAGLLAQAEAATLPLTPSPEREAELIAIITQHTARSGYTDDPAGYMARAVPPLLDASDREWDWVRSYISAHPEVREHRAQDEAAAQAGQPDDGRQQAAGKSRQAKAALDSGDFEQALALLDEAELLYPDHGISYGAARDQVRSAMDLAGPGHPQDQDSPVTAAAPAVTARPGTAAGPGAAGQRPDAESASGEADAGQQQRGAGTGGRPARQTVSPAPGEHAPDEHHAAGAPGGTQPLAAHTGWAGNLRPERLLYADGTPLTIRGQGDDNDQVLPATAVGAIPAPGDREYGSGRLQVIRWADGQPAIIHPALVSPAGIDAYAGLSDRDRARWEAFDLAEAWPATTAGLPPHLVDVGDVLQVERGPRSRTMDLREVQSVRSGTGAFAGGLEFKVTGIRSCLFYPPNRHVPVCIPEEHPSLPAAIRAALAAAPDSPETADPAPDLSPGARAADDTATRDTARATPQPAPATSAPAAGSQPGTAPRAAATAETGTRPAPGEPAGSGKPEPGASPLTNSDLATELRHLPGFARWLSQAGTPPAEGDLDSQRPGAGSSAASDARGIEITVSGPGFTRHGLVTWPQAASWIDAGVTPARLGLVVIADRLSTFCRTHRAQLSAAGTCDPDATAAELGQIRDNAIAMVVDAALRSRGAAAPVPPARPGDPAWYTAVMITRPDRAAGKAENAALERLTRLRTTICEPQPATTAEIRATIRRRTGYALPDLVRALDDPAAMRAWISDQASHPGEGGYDSSGERWYGASPDGLITDRSGDDRAATLIRWEEIPAWIQPGITSSLRDRLLAAAGASSDVFRRMFTAAVHPDAGLATPSEEEDKQAIQRRTEAVDAAWAAIEAAPPPSPAELDHARHVYRDTSPVQQTLFDDPPQDSTPTQDGTRATASRPPRPAPSGPAAPAGAGRPAAKAAAPQSEPARQQDPPGHRAAGPQHSPASGPAAPAGEHHPDADRPDPRTSPEEDQPAAPLPDAASPRPAGTRTQNPGTAAGPGHAGPAHDDDPEPPQTPATNSDLAIALHHMSGQELTSFLTSGKTPVHGSRGWRRKGLPDAGASEDLDFERSGVRITVRSRGFHRHGQISWRQVASWIDTGLTPARLGVIIAASRLHIYTYARRDELIAAGKGNIDAAIRELNQISLDAIDAALGAALSTRDPDAPVPPARPGKPAYSTTAMLTQPDPAASAEENTALARIAELKAAIRGVQPCTPADIKGTIRWWIGDSLPEYARALASPEAMRAWIRRQASGPASRPGKGSYDDAIGRYYSAYPEGLRTSKGSDTRTAPFILWEEIPAWIQPGLSASLRDRLAAAEPRQAPGRKRTAAASPPAGAADPVSQADDPLPRPLREAIDAAWAAIEAAPPPAPDELDHARTVYRGTGTAQEPLPGSPAKTGRIVTPAPRPRAEPRPAPPPLRTGPAAHRQDELPGATAASTPAGPPPQRDEPARAAASAGTRPGRAPEQAALPQPARTPVPLTDDDIFLGISRLPAFVIGDLFSAIDNGHPLESVGRQLTPYSGERAAGEPDPGARETVTAEPAGLRIQVAPADSRRTGLITWPQIDDLLRPGLTPARRQIVVQATQIRARFAAANASFRAVGEGRLAAAAEDELRAHAGAAVTAILSAARPAGGGQAPQPAEEAATIERIAGLAAALPSQPPQPRTPAGQVTTGDIIGHPGYRFQPFRVSAPPRHTDAAIEITGCLTDPSAGEPAGQITLTLAGHPDPVIYLVPPPARSLRSVPGGTTATEAHTSRDHTRAEDDSPGDIAQPAARNGQPPVTAPRPHADPAGTPGTGMTPGTATPAPSRVNGTVQPPGAAPLIQEDTMPPAPSATSLPPEGTARAGRPAPAAGPARAAWKLVAQPAPASQARPGSQPADDTRLLHELDHVLAAITERRRAAAAPPGTDGTSFADIRAAFTVLRHALDLPGPASNGDGARPAAAVRDAAQPASPPPGAAQDGAAAAHGEFSDIRAAFAGLRDVLGLPASGGQARPAAPGLDGAVGPDAGRLLDQAAAEAHACARWYRDTPEWQRMSRVGRAARELLTAIREAAGDYWAEIRLDIRVRGFARTLAARVSLAVSGAAHLLAGRLERAGHRSTRPWRAAWRLHQAAATFANRVMNYTPPGGPARVDDARRIIDDLGRGARRPGGPEPSRSASPSGGDTRTPGAVALGRECFPVLVSRANTRPGAAPAARTPAPPPPHQAPAAARR